MPKSKPKQEVRDSDSPVLDTYGVGARTANTAIQDSDEGDQETLDDEGSGEATDTRSDAPESDEDLEDDSLEEEGGEGGEQDEQGEEAMASARADAAEARASAARFEQRERFWQSERDRQQNELTKLNTQFEALLEKIEESAHAPGDEDRLATAKDVRKMLKEARTALPKATAPPSGNGDEKAASAADDTQRQWTELLFDTYGQDVVQINDFAQKHLGKDAGYAKLTSPLQRARYADGKRAEFLRQQKTRKAQSDETKRGLYPSSSGVRKQGSPPVARGRGGDQVSRDLTLMGQTIVGIQKRLGQKVQLK